MVRRIIFATVAAALAACSYHHTTVERPSQPATVVVPERAPDTVVVPDHHDTVIVPPQ